MARTKTEKIEKYYFNQFASAFSLPVGKIYFGDKPDLKIVDTQSQEILLGIEQTRFYIESGESKSSEQFQDKLRTRTIKEAEALYRRACKKNLRLSICFNKECPITSNGQDVARKLVDVAMTLQRTDLNRICSRKFDSIPEISFLYAQWDLGAPWQLTQVHSVPQTSKARLQDIVNSKDNKAYSYENCPELWLLVIIDFLDFAQDQDIDTSIDFLYSKHFSKVILFKTVFKEIKEIPCIQID